MSANSDSGQAPGRTRCSLIFPSLRGFGWAASASLRSKHRSISTPAAPLVRAASPRASCTTLILRLALTGTSTTCVARPQWRESGQPPIRGGWSACGLRRPVPFAGQERCRALALPIASAHHTSWHCHDSLGASRFAGGSNPWPLRAVLSVCASLPPNEALQLPWHSALRSGRGTV